MRSEHLSVVILLLAAAACTGEPDATESFCFDCGKAVPTNNPLIKMGLI